MPKNNTFNRKFASLIHILGKLNSGRRVTVSGIMESLEISKRTTYRYISILQEAGYPIYFDRDQMSYCFADGFQPESDTKSRHFDSLDLKHRMLASSPLGLLSYDSAGQCVEANESAAAIIGAATMTELLKQNLNRIRSWQKSGLLERAEEVMRTGKDDCGDFFIESSFGKSLWLNCSLSRFEKDGSRYLTVAFQNATDRKALEISLTNTRNELYAAQRLGKMGSWTLDLATNKVHWTPELYRMLALSPDEPPPDYNLHSRLFTPKSWELLKSSLKLTAAEGIQYELELEMIRSDGTRGWMLASGEAIFDKNERIVGLQGIAADITERKELERTARENEELLHEVIKRSPIAAFVKDEQLRILHINERSEEDTGITWKEMIGKESHELFPSRLARKIVADDSAVLDSGKSIVFEEQVGVKTVRTFKFPIVLGNRKFLAGYAIDITEQKTTEKELRIFKALTDVSGEAIAISDPDGRLIYINHAHERLFGRSLQDAVNCNYRDYYPPESIETLNREVATALARGEGWEGVLIANDKSGRHFRLWERADTIFDEQKNVLYHFGIMHEIED
ncbi:MAG: PAS domain S-box protein [Desulfuromonadaceae bacterium]|nr:PAS domain S-box protein [Desulfuromonadaceae bacterium]MDD2855093.1 PAS domain S-box protein [Desulfuromonadaceae bacterium]